MSKHSFERNDWPKLRAFVDETFGEGFQNQDFVFRGEPRCFPDVRPLLDRILFPDSRSVSSQQLQNRLHVELTAMLRFRQDAPMHLNDLEREILYQGMAAQMVMRHYGVPTRLLDWTESPWVALFMACRNDFEDDGRLLAFCRSTLTSTVHSLYSDETEQHRDDFENAEGWVVPKMLSKEFVEGAHEWIVCYHRTAERFPLIVAQQGLFTLGSKPNSDHWDVVKGLTKGSWWEIRIANVLKPTVMRYLRKMGVTHSSLFPGIGGVVEDIRSQIQLFDTSLASI